MLRHKTILTLFLIISFLIPLVFTPSYSLTETIDLFGQTNSVDLVLNDIWIEPENPKKGEAVDQYMVHCTMQESSK